ncbi:hypothetical protein AQUCO_00800077v1 [Aquilegia coerulea]|uniref:Bifunctional inhibitor/plant lipid transfer protein/seed storage helical domain-containing protein n=1 Tax=Aquilegia coerulea TaxID=218851 RepID=A0A2G5EHB0_AQUCA|nr:hypothetical protein AQUCO_00800077v1 [Aquilegia coerulea]
MKLSSSFVLLLVAFTVVAQLSHVARAEPPSEPYPVDCFDVVYNDLLGCLPFISDGGDIGKPDNGCCNGLKNVMKNDGRDRAQCVCELFHNSGKFGVSLNATRAKTLSSTCGIHHLSVDSCLSGSHHKHAPVDTPNPSLVPHYNNESPSPSPTTGRSSHSSAPSPAPSDSDDGSVPSDPTYGYHYAPAPAPKKSGASSVNSISVAVLLASIAASSLAYF